MITAMQTVTRLYTALVRLYPRSFRLQFEEEMRQVFADAVTDVETSYATSLRRGLSLAVVCLRELRDLPLSLGREHWHDLTKKEAPMRETAEVNAMVGTGQATPGHDTEPGSWRDAALAGLPHLLVALILGVPGLLRSYGVLAPYTQGMPASETLLGLGLGGSIVLVLIYSWRRGWPRWSAGWYAYGLAVAALPVLMLLQDGTTPTVVSGAFLFVVTPLALAWLLYRVACQDRLKGLLAALPVVTAAWHPILEFVPFPTRAWVLLSAWLVTALAAAAILRLGNFQIGVWLVIGVSLMVGLPFSYARTYLHNIPPAHVAEPTVWGLANRFAPQLIASSTLVLGPLLGRALRELGKRGGRMGVPSYRLALLGVLLSLMGNLGSLWLTTGHRMWPYRQTSTQIFTVMIYLGVLIYLLGSLCLVLAALRKRALVGGVGSVLLILIPLGLPLVVSIPFGFLTRTLQVRNIPESLVYAVGLVWLLLGGWLVTRLSMKKFPPQAAVG